MSALRDKRVLLVGAGGLGSPAGTLLARAGVGYLEVLDDDVVELSNLHRQTLFTCDDVGQSKVQRAAAQLQNIAHTAGHRHTEVRAHSGRLRPDVALDLVRGFDLVVEGSDNYPTKFLTADCCSLARVACVQAAAVRWVGWSLGFLPGQSACLRCVFEDIPEGPDQGCSTAGVIGPVVGVMGALQASIAVRLLLGQHEAAGVLHHYRALAGALRRTRIARSPRCPACTGQITGVEPTRYIPPDCAA
ncbi:MAG TPA: HesA/MoeB/ThiF family protein [Polyangiales bacterium]|nr:HesA/MoeB/ThiF family protein [Polyangiales bacterium]